VEEDVEMEVDEALDIEATNQRRQNNLATLNAIILSDPTLADMLLHGQGLQKMANSLAKAGQKWFDRIVLPNAGIEPKLGSKEVDVFYHHLALRYPNPHQIFPNPSMDNLSNSILEM
jgi:hypothetical protein